MMHLNPFDQPDVEAAKLAARARADAAERGEAAPFPSDAPGDVAALIASMRDGDYFAILAFLPMFDPVREALLALRELVRDGKRVATSVGFGPRYLHSTGQAFQGGPSTGTGVFLMLTCDAAADVAVPGRDLTFGDIATAQAAGDYDVLAGRGRRIAHVRLGVDLERGLRELTSVVARALRG
jgi:transaldolase/glucose-6-phosphate isomerase